MILPRRWIAICAPEPSGNFPFPRKRPSSRTPTRVDELTAAGTCNSVYGPYSNNAPSSRHRGSCRGSMMLGTASPSTHCCAGTERAPTSEPNSLCWPPIWGTSPWCLPTITCTGSSRSERPPAKDSPGTMAIWLCPCRAKKEGSDEEETSQPARRHTSRLLHRPPTAPSRDKPAHHPQLPRQPCAASAFSLCAQQATRGGTRLEGSGPTGNPYVSLLPGAATRNVRLSAIHALFRFVASRNPEHLDLAQRVLGIPFKRAPQRAIDYLEYEEIESILKAIDRTNLQGTRDYALLATMFNTGARVQEIADLRACDLQLTKPFQVKLFGKGKKERYCPLWPQTAAVLRAFATERNLDLRSEVCVFLNHHDQPLTRFGIRYILARCLARASRDVPNLRKKRLHPHSMRHSTAVALLKSGNDLSTIAHYLGHANPTTTNRYAKVDLEMKRRAIARVKPVPRQSRTPWSRDATILDWLESL